MNLEFVDSHVHLWKFNKKDFPWIKPNMGILAQDRELENLEKSALQVNYSCKFIVIQARQSIDENIYLLNIAEKSSAIVGVVGWIDLKERNILRKLMEYRNESNLIGFRHIIQDEPERDYILNIDFNHGIEQIINLGYAYDILVKKDQLKFVGQFLQDHPQGQFILDHAGKPDLTLSKMDLVWQLNIEKIASYDNVCCKISGLLTEGKWNEPNYDLFFEYITFLEEIFGEDRLLWGSDWPVSTLVLGYKDLFHLYLDFLGIEKFFKYANTNINKVYKF